MARLIVVADPAGVAEAAADRLMAVVGGAIEMRGVAHLALTGGSTAGALHRALLDPARRNALDWSQVEVWWGDDRLVGRADPLSNVRDPEATILAPETGLGLDPRRVHPFPIDEAGALGNDADWIAGTYAARVRERVPADENGVPVFDVVLLGVGPDGHILSVFPDSTALAPDAPLALAVPAPTHVEPHVPRVTLSPTVVTAARAILVMCKGAARAELVAAILEGPLDPRRLPAQLARGGNATWIVDQAAAAALADR
jgi:6-phosphogluconolactonase